MNPKTVTNYFMGDKTTSKADDQGHRANAAMLRSFFSLALSKMLSETIHHWEEKDPGFRDLAGGSGVQAMLLDNFLQGDYNIVYMAKMVVTYIPDHNCAANSTLPPTTAYEKEPKAGGPIIDVSQQNSPQSSISDRKEGPTAAAKNKDRAVAKTSAHSVPTVVVVSEIVKNIALLFFTHVTDIFNIIFPL